MTITQQDVIDILETGSYPTTQKALAYYQQKQKFPIYPFVEVRKVQSDSNTTDVTKTTIEQTFEVRYYQKWTRPEDVEEADRLATENEILNVLELANIEPPDVIYFENKQWMTTNIDDQIYGSKSVLRFTVRDIASTTGAGIIGSGDKIELNSEGTPLTIQILAISTAQGFSVDKHHTDEKKAVYDPNLLILHGEFQITYESDPTTTAAIKAISDSGDSNNGKLIRTGDEVQYEFYIGQTNSTGRYGEIETATTTFYANSIWV